MTIEALFQLFQACKSEGNRVKPVCIRLLYESDAHLAIKSM